MVNIFCRLFCKSRLCSVYFTRIIFRHYLHIYEANTDPFLPVMGKSRLRLNRNISKIKNLFCEQFNLKQLDFVDFSTWRKLCCILCVMKMDVILLIYFNCCVQKLVMYKIRNVHTSTDTILLAEIVRSCAFQHKICYN